MLVPFQVNGPGLHMTVSLDSLLSGVYQYMVQNMYASFEFSLAHWCP